MTRRERVLGWLRETRFSRGDHIAVVIWYGVSGPLGYHGQYELSGLAALAALALVVVSA